MSRPQITFRPPDEVMVQIEERAETAGLSVNEWLTRAVTFALASKSTNGYKITTITEVTF